MTCPGECPHERELGSLDAWRKSVDEKLNQILAQTLITNGRVRALEDWRNKAAGMAAGLGTVAGLVGTGIVTLIDWLGRSR